MNDPDLAWRSEEACLNAWPSPRQVVLDKWLFRFSGGPNRRTNSVNPLRASSHDATSIIGPARRLYHARNQPAIFRVPSIAHGMDAPLERAGFLAEGETCTLMANLDDFASADDPKVALATSPSAEWLSAKLRLTPVSDVGRQVYLTMMDAIVLPKAFAATRHSDQIVSVAYGAIHEDLLVVESVVTDAAFHNRGFGHLTVGRLMGWARREGARGACLQVVADNAAARALYRKLGFRTELYRYHYRREK
jgi:N-acetylglutamate synthase